MSLHTSGTDTNVTCESIAKALQRSLNRVNKVHPPLKQQQAELHMHISTKSRSEIRDVRADYEPIVTNGGVSIIALYDSSGISFALLDTVHMRCRKLTVRELAATMERGAKTPDKLRERAEEVLNRLHSLVN